MSKLLTAYIYNNIHGHKLTTHTYIQLSPCPCSFLKLQHVKFVIFSFNNNNLNTLQYEMAIVPADLGFAFLFVTK